jgi:hypothetical protein
MNIQDQQAFKGAGFKAMLRAITELYGEPALQKVLQAAGPELRQYTARKVLENEWIPDRIGTDLLITADKVLGRGDYTLIRTFGYHVAKDNLKGIYKIYIKITSISGLLKRADQIWSQYFNTGKVKVVMAEEKHFQFEVLDYSPYPDTCIGVLGWLDMFLEVYKVKGVASHPQCKLKGSGKCIFDIKLE